VTTETERGAVLSPTPREQLRDLITELAVVRGKVTLSSGREADYYVDLRRITLHHRAAPAAAW
jgi:orotate phosphoribosyltransferase